MGVEVAGDVTEPHDAGAWSVPAGEDVGVVAQFEPAVFAPMGAPAVFNDPALLCVVVADEGDDVSADVLSVAGGVDAVFVVEEVFGEVDADGEWSVFDEGFFDGCFVVWYPAPVGDFDGSVLPAGEALVGEVGGFVGVGEAAFVGDAGGDKVVGGVCDVDVAGLDSAAGVEVEVCFAEVWCGGGVEGEADFGFEAGDEGVGFAGGCG